jgi:hypothetical protein
MSIFRYGPYPEGRSYFLTTFSRGHLVRKSIWEDISLVTVVFWFLLFVAELAASFFLSDHHLIFTLDDPYIHLAVADHILSGGYGVNASEFSSPCSSIIWPYLLAVPEILNLGAFGPLLINAIAASAAVVAFVRILKTEGLVDYKREKPLFFAIVVLAIMATSAVALPMTGMEHSLHVWASIVTFAGLAAAARGRSPTFVQFVALILLPLIRFEGAAFALAAIGGFALLGKRYFAASAAMVIVASLAVYSALMVSRGLPLLPSSVLLKSRIAETAYGGSKAFDPILHNLVASLTSPYGLRLLLLALALAWGTWLLRANRNVRSVCLAALAAAVAHIAFGQYDWFHRYEVYIIALASLALFYVVAHLKPTLSVPQWTAAKVGVVCLIGFAGTPYMAAVLETPFASRGIYEQQYQMSVFTRQLYNRPVAVNDLGLVAYKNSNFALDLWGLGSESVRRAKMADRYGPEEMAALANEHDVGLVMIYDTWFPQGVPATWTKIAVLHTNPVTAAAGDVAFYRTPAANTEEVDRALASFQSILPVRDTLEIVKPVR